MKNHEKILAHIERNSTVPVRDPLWNNIYLSPGIKELIKTRPFLQLGNIKQLGPAYMVYPGATHTRLNHSLGVFHLARRIITRLMLQEGCPDLTREGVESFLCAALLHDLGHFPYTHSLKELPLKSHEVLTGELIREDPLAPCLKENLGLNPDRVASIVDTSLPENDAEILFYRNILSGVLDPDKLDYLNRDAYFCGVPYGIQDTDFVIAQMVPRKDGTALLEKGIPGVENILFSKYLMYKTVYWHKSVRIATAMVKKAIILGLKKEEILPEELYGLTDQELMARYGGENFCAHKLFRGVNNREFYKMVYQADFDEANPRHRELLDLDFRLAKEAEIAGALASQNLPADPCDVIIDIPEPISFEIDLPIVTRDGEVPFSRAPSVFDPPVIRSFSGNLRKIRLFVFPPLQGSIREKGAQELLG